MVEEGQSKVKVSLNFQKLVEMEEQDRISVLPDCLLVEILTRLPTTKEAVRTGTLSKRWKHVWTSVHTLNFKHYEPYATLNPHRPNPKPMSDFVSFVDKTLTQRRQLKLKKFVLITYCDVQFQSQLKNWIRYAISCNVENFRIVLSGTDDRAKFLFDQNFFISSCFIELVLQSCILNPIGAISWKNLRSLRLYYMNLDEDMIENILSGSPQLETLILDNCYGFKLINITSKSVNKLWFSGYPNHKVTPGVGDIIKINAPNILSLLIEDDLVLSKLLLVDVSCLVKAYLDYYTLDDYYNPTPKEAEEEMLKGFIVNLRHVKELEIGWFCSKVLSRLEAKGFDFPSNIKFPHKMWSDSDSVESED